MTEPTTAPTKPKTRRKSPAAKKRNNRAYGDNKRAQGFTRIQVWVLPEDAPRFHAIAKKRRNRALTKVAFAAPA